MDRNYGDPKGLTPASLEQVSREDQALLAAVVRTDAEGVFQAITAHWDRRHIRGLPPVYTLLSRMPATAGAVLKYNRTMGPATQSMASYASVVFH